MFSRFHLTVALAMALPVATLASPPGRAPARLNADLFGHVVDSAYGKPVAGADVIVRRAAIVVARATTDQFGSWRVHDLAPGSYAVVVRLIGFRPETRTVVVGATSADVAVDITLAPEVLQLSELSVTASPIAVDTRTGDQMFKQSDYQGAPTVTTSQSHSAIDRRRGARSHRRSAHSRTARGVHVLHGRPAGAARDLR